MKSAKSINLFENLATLCEYEGHCHDFHNDYALNRLLFLEKNLNFLFKSEKNNNITSLIFINTDMCFFDFFQTAEDEDLTIDTLYRGRVESGGKLIDLSEDNKAYFYAEFFEGQKIEFWAEGFVIQF